MAGWTRLRRQVEWLTRRDDGDDLLQDAYLRLSGQPEFPDNVEAFLVRVAVNRGRDAHRRERTQAVHSQELPDLATMDMVADPAPIQDETLIARERLARVQEGLARLPPRTRQVFLMQRLDGMRYRDIAATLLISQSAVEKHMAKATMFLARWSTDW